MSKNFFSCRVLWNSPDLSKLSFLQARFPYTVSAAPLIAARTFGVLKYLIRVGTGR